MRDIEILDLLSKKDTYLRFKQYIKPHLVSQEAYQILDDMDEWFATNNTVDWKKFAVWFKIVKHPMYKPDKMLVYDKVFNDLEGYIPDDDLQDKIAKVLVDRDFATRIADKTLRIAEGSEKDKMDDILDLIDQYKTESNYTEGVESFIVSHDISATLTDTHTGGLNWRLEGLQNNLGAARKGDFIVVAARPDSGKTTFLASEATYMAPQMEEEQNVIWFNNEEGGSKVKNRIVQAALELTDAEMLADISKVKDDYVDMMGRLDKIVIVDRADIGIHDIRVVLDNYNPGLIIFDQLWKVNGFGSKSSNEVARITSLYNWGREVAKEYAPVITVHQADGSAEGEMWLTQNQLYLTKTAGPGEADAIIGIGRRHDPTEENTRYFNIPKNKMKTGAGSRNGRFVSEIDPARARFNMIEEVEIDD
jgi:replicative DNA helicase